MCFFFFVSLFIEKQERSCLEPYFFFHERLRESHCNIYLQNTALLDFLQIQLLQRLLVLMEKILLLHIESHAAFVFVICILPLN